jgi:dolichol-phosphate mannosyltransferase
MGVLTLLAGSLFLLNRLFPSFTLLNYWVGINPGITTMILYFSVLFSVLFFCLGIIGEYLALLIKEVKRRPAAIVGSVVGGPECSRPHFILEPPPRELS